VASNRESAGGIDPSAKSKIGSTRYETSSEDVTVQGRLSPLNGYFKRQSLNHASPRSRPGSVRCSSWTPRISCWDLFWGGCGVPRHCSGAPPRGVNGTTCWGPGTWRLSSWCVSRTTPGVTAETVCELLRKIAALALGVPITLVLDNARHQRIGAELGPRTGHRTSLSPLLFTQPQPH